MLENTFIKKIKLSNVFIPLLIVIVSCSLLIISNYLTIKILSASRAYINGESHYSKGQKDATLHLITYLFTKDIEEWRLFNSELSVPIGDKTARLGLINNSPIEAIEVGLRAGRNNQKDFDDLIWLFKNFKSVSFFAKAIKEWEQGDLLIEELALIGNEAHLKVSTNNLSLKEQHLILKKINSLTVKLTQNERKFSETLSSGTRLIKNLLLAINVFFTLIIIGSVSIYYLVMVTKLKRAKQQTDETNKNLTIVNKELDKFGYSVSHDLRSPITSLKGLIEIMNSENNIEQIRNYLAMMNESLDKQDQFIKDIIEYSRNKKIKTNVTTVSLNKIIDDTITQNKYRQEADNIIISKQLSINIIYSDELKLKIILNNLYTNAVKYYDDKKEKPFITITAFEDVDSNKIIIEDNGIGIKQEYQTKIFDMFFVTNNNNKGTGLGLYLVKDAVENLKGNIEITSEVNKGTKFTITLPKKVAS
ncbi:sensor histidine kinase [Flavobacterium undicola]|uniref:sensor histidine kinase n=1 Tax=Flavobacterium undicola TaxID=1932779 RepID=UPI0013780F81|nr:HAMP domain-containing sensor histidine kinase [Flavobacterium undicola]MBA0883577.1 HAMP domain-containing histidine kinase [Flavobacterium undicola]